MTTLCGSMDVDTDGHAEELPTLDMTTAAGATAAVATTATSSVTMAATSAAGAVAAVAAAAVTSSAVDACLLVQDQGDRVVPMSTDAVQKASFQPAPAWDAHLDNPTGADPKTMEITQVGRRAGMGLTTDKVQKFIDSVEFISLGCFCAVSHCLQLLGLKKNSYPFDWVRSSTDGIVHSLDMQFEDFLTYSTYEVKGQYIVFGGTRWGGSFWHHNLEVPLTKTDMQRRVTRFYGAANVPAQQPRFFVRVVNSSREVMAAPRLREALRRALPEAGEIFLLTVVDLQSSPGPLAIPGVDGHGLLFYAISESETLAPLTSMSPGPDSFLKCSETYAKAVAFAVKYWSGEETSEQVMQFQSIRHLSAAFDQFDGGNPGSDLFFPKKFMGQTLAPALPGTELQNLLSKFRTQTCILPQDVNPLLPFHMECFGKHIVVKLPPATCAGNILQVMLCGTVLTASVSLLWQGQWFPIGAAEAEEQLSLGPA
eukprot:TRINITY_DN60871_c0_g1_i1.p1 TRINITY_DN60871_c0_g1~~TRINITY_DN60871_c0_g1_i1.p1  ORF type:complete len:482 (+),score=86.90 TRINITY_DN60871_c0_g1_i1:94-1539(+)